MWSLVRAQWTCHVVVFVDSTLGYRITLTKRNTDTAFLCMVFGLFALRHAGYLILGKSAPSKRGLNLPQAGSLIKGFPYTKLTNNCFGGCAPLRFHSTFSSWDPNRWVHAVFVLHVSQKQHSCLSHIQCKKSIYPFVDINRWSKMTKWLMASLHSCLEICLMSAGNKTILTPILLET